VEVTELSTNKHQYLATGARIQVLFSNAANARSSLALFIVTNNLLPQNTLASLIC
jgi:hypothetical protein